MPGPPSSGVQNVNGQGVRVAELVAALSYAADLGLGQPLAHCMRQTVIALRLADLVGATQDEREATYYLGLMISAYCHADAAEQARWFGDDIACKADAFDMLGKNMAQIVAFAVRRTGSHGTGVDRARRIVRLPRSGMRQVMDFLATATPDTTRTSSPRRASATRSGTPNCAPTGSLRSSPATDPSTKP